ncbi:9081_t:CDS:2 [Funneliformis geosporum]|uniref:9081_t:CDS:1 n=1 Tax=Funneliformis geosporum TaxID=1117311 RepID=A0A9W4SVH4_9GLOM|nr:9081_t:CDS:2 [Funneliformis geosporum]
MDNNDNNESDIDEEDKKHIPDGIIKDILVRCFEQARKARHQNIVLMEFTRRFPNISEEEKNGLFNVFSSSEAFGTKIHNALLDALADPVKG